MEQYLIDEYGVIEDVHYLKSADDIKGYFEDVGEYFDCGQGYYEDVVTLMVKIGEKFYSVTIEAQIESAKQEYGDRLYWVSGLKDISYEECDKPKPPKEKVFTTKIFCNESKCAYYKYYPIRGESYCNKEDLKILHQSCGSFKLKV